MENNTEKKEVNAAATQQKISTPVAIVVAGFLIMVGILLTKNGGINASSSKSISEQVGVAKDKLVACIKNTDVDELNTSINDSVDKAMSHIPRDNGRGTPYTIVVGPNGFMTEIRGAETYDNTKAIITAAMDGHIATKDELIKQSDGTFKKETHNLTEIYRGNVALSESRDHIQGNSNAKVTLIEYADFECIYCKRFLPILEKIMKENNGNVRWIYRHYPIHQHSFEKLVAAECVAKLKGNDAFWKYSDLLFGLLKTGDESVSEQL